MTNKDFKEGMKERSLLGGTVDYQYSANYQPKHRTIDDLECGDYVVDKDVEKNWNVWQSVVKGMVCLVLMSLKILALGIR